LQIVSKQLADLTLEHFSRLFDLPDSQNFDFVFNCAGTDLASSSTTSDDAAQDDVHKLRTHALSVSLATETAKRGIPVYVELSTGNVYKSSAKKPATEADGKIKPSTRQAKWKYTIEEDLKKLCESKDEKERLNAVVLRLANVYGPYVTRFIGQALCLARVYEADEKEMRWLWGEGLRTDTVHVEDVARGMWEAAEWLRDTPRGKRDAMPVFNMVDGGQTSKSQRLIEYLNIPNKSLQHKVISRP
jgi:nucleoside-diphosphate-sugar epimerase